MKIQRDFIFEELGYKVWYINNDVFVETPNGYDLHEFNEENNQWKITRLNKDLMVLTEELRSI